MIVTVIRIVVMGDKCLLRWLWWLVRWLVNGWYDGCKVVIFVDVVAENKLTCYVCHV